MENHSESHVHIEERELPKLTTEERREIANTIAVQLAHGGNGYGRLKAMLGADNFMFDEIGALSFSFKMCRKANRVRIELNSHDLYDITFYKLNMRAVECPVVREFHDVYAEDLARTFREYTGLDTHL